MHCDSKLKLANAVMLKRLYLVSICLLFPGFANAGLFSITIEPDATIDNSVLALFNDAVSFWESAILGTQEDIDINLVIEASTPPIDGTGGVLGSAGPSVGSFTEFTGEYLYASEGSMRFDSADVTNMQNNNTLFDVILHEMAHVIGFGTLWNPTFTNGGTQFFQNVYVENSGEYTGSYALSLYQELFNSSATYVPIELDGGSGTANSHWDEGFINNSGELLTGYLDSNPFLSDISLASFADIGYVVRLSDGRVLGAVAVYAPSSLAIIGFAFFSLLRPSSRKFSS